MGNVWDTESLDAIGGFTYTLVSPAAFATADLSQYDVLYVPSAFQNGGITIASQASLDALNQRASAIASYVSGGGGLVALAEPIGTGRYAWTPLPVTPSAHINVELITVASPAHAINTGLSSGALSYWLDSSHHSYDAADPQYELLATTTLGGAIMSLAGTYGSGRLFLTGQDPDYHAIEADGTSAVDAGARVLLSNALDWACATAAQPGDADADGCTDAQELGAIPALGGDRNPQDFWDFFDVSGPSGVRDKAIDLQDTLAILSKFGKLPGQVGYEAAYDRMAPDPSKPYRTAAATGAALGIDVQDALLNLQSFGHSCAPAP